MKIRPIFAWYDLWVGVFIDRPKQRAYVFPLPMLGFVIDLGGQRDVSGYDVAEATYTLRRHNTELEDALAEMTKARDLWKAHSDEMRASNERLRAQLRDAIADRAVAERLLGKARRDGATDSLAGDPVPAVDPSRFFPNTERAP